MLQPVRDGGWWNVAESNAALSATAIRRKTARKRPKGCNGGGRPGDTSTGDRKPRPLGQRLKGTYHWSCPQGTWYKFSGVR